MKLGAAIATVPLVFGSLSVFPAIGYAVAALSVCVSVLLMLTGTEWLDSGRCLVEQVIPGVRTVDTRGKVPEGGKSPHVGGLIRTCPGQCCATPDQDLAPNRESPGR